MYNYFKIWKSLPGWYRWIIPQFISAWNVQQPAASTEIHHWIVHFYQLGASISHQRDITQIFPRPHRIRDKQSIILWHMFIPTGAIHSHIQGHMIRYIVIRIPIIPHQQLLIRQTWIAPCCNEIISLIGTNIIRKYMAQKLTIIKAITTKGNVNSGFG